jgi:hypothetical protein
MSEVAKEYTKPIVLRTEKRMVWIDVTVCECVECHQEFDRMNPRAIFCGKRCGQRAGERRRYKSRKKAIGDQ